MPRRTVNQRAKVPREEGTSPKVRAQMDRFVEGQLMGLGSAQAAVYAGIPPRRAASVGYKWRLDPYVRARYAKLREKLTRDEICSFAELALDVKSIAFNEFGNADTRLRGHALLARIMGFEAPTKVDGTLNSNVMLIPIAQDMTAWEQQAIAAQAALMREVEADANR
jgi:hypothetical protein